MNPIIHIIRRAQIRANAPRIAAHPNPYGVDIRTDIPYRDDGKTEHLLDVYRPDARVVSRPVIVELHGGGYLSCTKEINAQHGQYLASKGFCVLNINYTVCPEGCIPIILSELVDALGWVRRSAGAFGFDTARVFLTGDSSGGHFVLMAADAFTTGRCADFFGVPDPPIQPAGYGASCPEGSFEWRLLPRNLPARMLFFLLHRYTFDRDCARNASYESFMGPGYPAVWFCTSSADSLLYAHTRRIHEYMLERGYPHEYRQYESPERRLDHVFNILNPDYPESRTANDDMLRYFLSLPPSDA